MKRKKTEIYALGDTFLINETIGKVVFINHGNAWLSPIKDEYIDDEQFLVGVVFAKLDKYGKCNNKEVTRINKNITICGAI